MINQISFQSSQKINTFGFSDTQSQNVREKLREKIIQDTMPFYSYWVKEPRLEEEQLKELLRPLIGNKPKEVDVDYKTIHSIHAYNLRPIGNNSYRGSTLYGHPDALRTLKKAGIKRVIDLTENSIYKEQVEKAGLEYFTLSRRSCPTKSFWFHPALRTKDDYFRDQVRYSYDYMSEEEKQKLKEFYSEEYNKESRNFIDNMIKMIKCLDEGYCYIGCEFGTYDTDDALILYDLFSPRSDKLPDVDNEYKGYALEGLYSNLTPEDKKKLGWDEEFDNYVQGILKACHW